MSSDKLWQSVSIVRTEMDKKDRDAKHNTNNATMDTLWIIPPFHHHKEKLQTWQVSIPPFHHHKKMQTWQTRGEFLQKQIEKNDKRILWIDDPIDNQRFWILRFRGTWRRKQSKND